MSRSDEQPGVLTAAVGTGRSSKVRPGCQRARRGAVACLFILCACSSDAKTSSGTGPQDTASAQTALTSPETTSPPDTSATSPLRLVALGDSDATGQGDPSGQGWVGRYAALVEQQTGRQVDVVNRAEDGLVSDQMLGNLQTDESLRADVAAADIIVIAEGGADLNAGDETFEAGTCAAEACYKDDLAAFEKNIDDATVVIAQLRKGQPTVLRAVTLANGLTGAEDVIPPFLAAVATQVGVYQASSLRDSLCSAMQNHGGQCIDVLTAFNGPDGTINAYELGLMNHEDCCYPSDKGQQLMAELLLETGLEAVSLQ